MKKLESEARATKSEMSEVKKISQKSIKRVESLEKEVKIVKAIMEDLRGMGMSGQGGKKEASSGSRMSSTDVSLAFPNFLAILCQSETPPFQPQHAYE